MRVLLAGATGRLGSLLVPLLTEQAVTVRALTRDPGRCARLAGVEEVVVGDVRRPATLRAACVGTDIVVSAVQGFAGPGRVSPRTVDDIGNRNLIAAAQQSGSRMVLVSVVGAAPDHPMELFQAKAAAEAALHSSGVPWTIVRAAAFAELWLENLGQRRGTGPGRQPHQLRFGRRRGPCRRRGGNGRPTRRPDHRRDRTGEPDAQRAGSVCSALGADPARPAGRASRGWRFLPPSARRARYG